MCIRDSTPHTPLSHTRHTHTNTWIHTHGCTHTHRHTWTHTNRHRHRPGGLAHSLGPLHDGAQHRALPQLPGSRSARVSSRIAQIAARDSTARDSTARDSTAQHRLVAAFLQHRTSRRACRASAITGHGQGVAWHDTRCRTYVSTGHGIGYAEIKGVLYLTRRSQEVSSLIAMPVCACGCQQQRAIPVCACVSRHQHP
eukprot:162329-Rhodomonas_salina.1